MEEELISFEVAKLAKEKGLEQDQFPIYLKKRNGSVEITYINKLHFNDDRTFYAPTQSFLQRWLREVHNIDVSIITNYKDREPISSKSYRVGIIYVKDNIIDSFFIRPGGDRFEFIEFKSYELALEQGLKEALTLI